MEIDDDVVRDGFGNEFIGQVEIVETSVLCLVYPQQLQAYILTRRYQVIDFVLVSLFPGNGLPVTH
jgi:hypothetical protein